MNFRTILAVFLLVSVTCAVAQEEKCNPLQHESPECIACCKDIGFGMTTSFGKDEVPSCTCDGMQLYRDTDKCLQSEKDCSNCCEDVFYVLTEFNPATKTCFCSMPVPEM